MQTGDSFDFQFRNDGDDNDKIIIKPGRARLGINESACSTYCQYMQSNLIWKTAGAKPASPDFYENIEIEIKAGASSVLAAGAMSLIALFAF